MRAHGWHLLLLLLLLLRLRYLHSEHRISWFVIGCGGGPAPSVSERDGWMNKWIDGEIDGCINAFLFMLKIPTPDL